MQTSNKKLGFTLIELLIVIVIIGILAGVVLAIINPARVIRRSNEGTARSKVAKACLAYISCLDSTRSSTSGAIDRSLCDTEDEIGITSGTFAAVAAGSNQGQNGTYSLLTAGTDQGRPRWGSNDSPACTITCNDSGRIDLANCIIN